MEQERWEKEQAKTEDGKEAPVKQQYGKQKLLKKRRRLEI